MLNQITNSAHFYHYLLAAVALLAAFDIFEITFLLVHKRRLENAEARKDALKKRIATEVITEELPWETLPRPADGVEYAAYSEAVSSILDSFEGLIAERAGRLLKEFNIDAYYKRQARDPAWFKRANAVDTLSAFKLPRNREFFLAAFRSEPSAAVRYRMLYGLSLLVRDREDLEKLAVLLSSLPYLTAKYTEDLFFNSVTCLKLAGKEEEFAAFMRGIMKRTEVGTLVKRDCVSACNSVSCEQEAPVIREYSLEFWHEPEVIISCVKSLVRLGDFTVIGRALRHPDWRVRLTALKFAHLADITALGDVRAMLRDSNYHLRINAALALSRLGPRGVDILRVAAASGDGYAAGAAAYALDCMEAP